MKRKRTTERYWAVRIGIPGKHLPYFMLQDGCYSPALFTQREDALVAKKSLHAPAAVVRVTLKENAK